MSEHIWVQENLETYLTDGLRAEERSRMDRHLSGCHDCSRALTESRDLDSALLDLFTPARPAPGMESRLIEALRPKAPRRRPMMRFIMGAAAVILLGTLGFALQSLGVIASLPFPGENLSEQRAEKKPTKTGFSMVGGTVSHGQVSDDPSLVWKDTIGIEFSQKLTTKAGGELAVADPGAGGSSEVAERLSELSGKLTSHNNLKTHSPDVSVNIRGKAGESRNVDEIGLLDDLRTQLEARTKEKADNAPDHEQARIIRESAKPERSAPALEEREKTKEEDTTKSIFKEIWGGRQHRPDNSPHAEGSPGRDKFRLDGDIESAKAQVDEAAARLQREQQLLTRKATSETEYRSTDAALKKAMDNLKELQARRGADGKKFEKENYFELPPAQEKGGESKSKSPDDPNRSEEPQKGGKGQDSPPGESKTEPKPGGKKTEQPESKDPTPLGRKIIRTGEVEYEIERFDAAVEAINKLINSIPGAFIATVNSDKQPTGKMRGSVVVRMPPERLDKFLDDLRDKLAKVGELKTQRIGSQDVTKQYYDIESRLRAARTMEDRLINIIKTGKGEIKDLITAERELGNWRTKIEELEGEIRYYNNQVSLSTLTITLVEKAMLVSERNVLAIETEDVVKAFQTARAAVSQAKGRVTRSDLKKHAAGQFEAVLCFEVAPAAAEGIRIQLEQLGIVTQHDAERLQQGATLEPPDNDGKGRQPDVVFEVTIYNIANIAPRDTHVLQVAVPDVAAEFHKLKEAVEKAKGWVRTAQLNEQDRLNVNAQFDFDVPTSQQATFDKLLASIGDVLSRSTARAGPKETSTERKIGYRVTLKNFEGIPPREAYVIQIAAQDVALEYRKLQDTVAQAKGQTRGGQLNEQDKLNVTAKLDFDVPAKERSVIDKALAALGDIVSRSTVRAAPGDAATDRKVGYSVTFKNVASIPPRETLQIEGVSLDVPSGYRKLQEIVQSSGGHIRKANLNEQEKTNVSAQLDFDVPAAARDTIDKAMGELGEVYSRRSDRIAPGEAATEGKVGFRVQLRSVSGMQPREKITLAIEVKDVEQTASMLKDLVKARGGTVLAAPIKHDASGQVTAVLLCDIPMSAREDVVRKFKNSGIVRVLEEKPNTQAPETKLATVQLNVALASSPPIVPNDEGLWPQIHTSLFYSFKLLMWSLMFIILGVMVVLPWAIVVWVVVRLVRRWNRGRQTAVN